MSICQMITERNMLTENKCFAFFERFVRATNDRSFHWKLKSNEATFQDLIEAKFEAQWEPWPAADARRSEKLKA